MFSNPKENIKELALGPGMVVADFGAGSGFYTLAAARAVGPSGKVYAVDIQQELLHRLKNEAGQARLSNVEVFWGDLAKEGGSHLPNQVADAAIVANILFQIREKDSFVKELTRVLKPGGRVLLVEWKDSFGRMGPEPGDVVGEEAAKNLFVSRGGFSFEKNVSAGEHHYGMILCMASNSLRKIKVTE